MWPFSKNKNSADQASDSGSVSNQQGANATQSGAKPVGPFDADKENIEDFDFSDYAQGGLDLQSILVPIPQDGEVQVEMGSSGPTAIHIVTSLGRITPIAFADSRQGGLWSESIDALSSSLSNDGVNVSIQEGPWGQELIGETEQGVVYIIGAPGDRWLYRVTGAGPKANKDGLIAQTREVAARSFVRRGNAPVPVGKPLPVLLSESMVNDLQQAINAQNAVDNDPSQEHNDPETGA